MKKLYIRHASELVTCRGKAPRRGREMADIGLIEDGAVLLSDGRIEAVGTTKELDRRLGLDPKQSDALHHETASISSQAAEPADTELNGQPATILNAWEKTVLPGFVDSHTHFIFGGFRADEFSWRLKGDSYMSIMERGGGINATIRDKYFSGASATPAAVFPVLVNLAQKHLKKLNAANRGLSIAYEKQMTELLSKLGTEYPAHLNLPQQGSFQLGYYFQTQARYQKKEEK